MALNIGDTDCTLGLSKRIFDQLLSDAPTLDDNAFKPGVKRIAYAIAKSVVDEIHANATVSVPGTGLAAPNGPVTGLASGTVS